MEECSMDRVYAFTDEYGGFGWNLVNPTVSSNYYHVIMYLRTSNIPILRYEIYMIWIVDITIYLQKICSQKTKR